MSPASTAPISPPASCELAVIGAGMAGMAAALFASARGFDVAQVGNAGALLFASGPFDLLALHPVAERRVWDDPWAAMAAVARDMPHHPYAHAQADRLRDAFSEVVDALGEVGLPYTAPGESNLTVPTALGTVKHSLCVPRSMAAGVEAVRDRADCLVVDFERLREFSARQMVATMQAAWPHLRAARISFPGTEGATEVYATHIARALDLPAARQALIARIRPHLGAATHLGLPAVLGLRRTTAILAELEERLGVRVFEVPTMPTSVPGLRLKDAFERLLAARGVRRVVHGVVSSATVDPRGFTLTVGKGKEAHLLRARSVILATGRFMGRGLIAERALVREAVFGLPVTQPAARSGWHREAFFDPAGHAVNRAGVETDELFRPLDADGRPLHPRLHAAGSVLAHADWMRMKCGSGVAIASARASVEALVVERGAS